MMVGNAGNEFDVLIKHQKSRSAHSLLHCDADHQHGVRYYRRRRCGGTKQSAVQYTNSIITSY